MTLQEFVSTYQGQAASYDGLPEDVGQCVQLVCVYWQRVYGFSCPPIPAAKDLWTNPAVLATFNQIPVGQEQPGDVAVWGASSLINSPEYGHTDIVLTPGFVGLDSNWGGVKNSAGQPIAHKVAHNYVDVLGFLRHKEEDMADIFNEGDRVNVNNSLFGADKGFFKDQVNKTYKQALEHILGSPEFLNEQYVNGGDVVNIANAGGWPQEPGIKGWLWKRMCYDYLFNKVKK